MNSYSFFLFSQLFVVHSNDKNLFYSKLPYDELYPIAILAYKVFISSKYNTDKKSEYDCILDYLFANYTT